MAQGVFFGRIHTMKRVFIIHMWDGHPEEVWYPWLKQELEKKGFAVQIPAMPHPENPTIEDWVPYISSIVGKPDEHTYFVGHSVGSQMILRYLEGLPFDKKVGGVVFVAGFFELMGLDEEEQKIAKPWLETPIDCAKVKQHTNKFVAIFSDNDPFVPLSNVKLMEQRLGAKTIVEKGKSHFSGDDGVKELPSVLQSILDFAGE